MRPRVNRREGVVGGEEEARIRERARQLAALHPITDSSPANEPEVAAELWIGVHLQESPVPEHHAAPEHRSVQEHCVPQEYRVPQEHRARQRLEELATRAQQFTPRVSLAPPDGVLLEVKGSLHLFNGTSGLLHALECECARLGVKSTLALAPTPLAALVAARVGSPFVVTGWAQLVGQLASMPLTPLRWDRDILERLARMGVRTIGQALRLPRAGFAARFGVAQLAELDRLTGRKVDPRERFKVRERFRRRRELTCELESHESLLAVLAPLCADLGRFLEMRQCGILQLECLLRHRHAPPSSCVLRLAAPAAEATRLEELLGERLSALVLPEPVCSCELRSGPLVRRAFASNPLWQPGEHGGGAGAESPELIERLRARLGVEAVYGLKVLTGHRPEKTWEATEPSSSSTSPAHPPWPAFQRPLWLLPAPQRLRESEGLPRYRGALRLLGDAERIETGWWDEGDIGRDYYVALDIHGTRLWIFREREAPSRWFLHGVFG